MTREEKLDWLYRLKSDICVYMPKEWIIPMNNALDAAIEALEQEPVYYPPCIDCNKKMDEIRNDYDSMTAKALEQESILDKIREEIDGAKMPKNRMSFFRDGIDCALQIIDKYRGKE